MKPDNTYPNTLEQTRRELGLTFHEFSRCIYGHKSNHIWSLLKGRMLPSTNIIPAIEEVTGKPWSDVYRQWYDNQRKSAVQIIREVVE